ncbi:LPS export ABC transporter permease LptG [Rhizobium sp. KVB221]|uniref:LPS export ABC transporter permease LptG n=1 Tax=Rhizobium setariae TaxID=2801340 RepID=A0A936YN83_9HYPH|nr:LPS export ABC transporter permease LptG [Rhizobium setariae]MBL0371239.1 LPS export ABC transporter permease LptG [Rhizobium setariae]
MMTGTLFRYFLKRHLSTIFWFFLGVASLVFLIDFIENSSLRGSVPGFTLLDSLYLTLVRMPLILQQTVPFIMLLAGITTLVTLNRRQEMVVTRAAGISVWQFMMPFVTGAMITGLLALFVLNPIAAAGMRVAQQVESSAKAAKQLGRRNQTIPWLRQITSDDDVVIGAMNVDEGGTLLRDAVFIHFGPEGRIILRQDAATASLKDGYWLLNEVKVTRPGEIPEALDTVQVRTNLKREFVQERLSRPETVSFLGLPQKIEAARSFGVSTFALETQFHSLISMPFLLVAMTLISATVSLKFSRFNQSQSMIFGGVFAGFVLYVATVLIKAFGSSGVVPPFVAAWIPVVVAMFLGTTLLLHQEDG